MRRSRAVTTESLRLVFEAVDQEVHRSAVVPIDGVVSKETLAAASRAALDEIDRQEGEEA